MISEKDYLKSYKMMNEAEKKDYLDSVVRWSEETFPGLMALADSWEKVPVKDFDEGLRLVSAIMNARSFIPVAQRYEARRAINKINQFLTEVRDKSGLAKKTTRPAKDTRRYRAIVPEKGVPGEDGALKRREYKEEDVDGRRPEHLHQYIHLLSDKLKKRAEALPDMYLALAEFRGLVDEYSKNANTPKEAMSEMAKKSVEQEKEIRAIWAEIDEELAVADGKEPAPQPVDFQSEMKRASDYTKAEIDTMIDPERQEYCKGLRIEANKKYVRRTDVNVTDDYKEQMVIRITELMEWDEFIPTKASSICEQAGIVVPGFNDSKPAKAEKKETPEENTSDNEKKE